MYLLLLYTGACFAQNKTGKKYAVVVGIASYENKSLRELVYSNKDAQAAIIRRRQCSSFQYPVIVK
jgi:hypothetical protein